MHKPIYLKLVKGLADSNASAVWSATKNEGYGRSINMYEQFGIYTRQDARSRTLSSMSGFEELLNELLGHPDMKGPDMRRSRKYVAEILEAAKLKHAEFLKQTQTIGESTCSPCWNRNVLSGRLVLSSVDLVEDIEIELPLWWKSGLTITPRLLVN
jgi:hypothetical protein